jgi:hypothetical protein
MNYTADTLLHGNRYCVLSSDVSRLKRLTDDMRLEIALIGTASRLIGQPKTDAVAELPGLAHGRADLLARAAGHLLGWYLGRPGTTDPSAVYAAALLLLAGADPDLTVEHTEAIRLRVQAPSHGAR